MDGITENERLRLIAAQGTGAVAWPVGTLVEYAAHHVYALTGGSFAEELPGPGVIVPVPAGKTEMQGFVFVDWGHGPTRVLSKHLERLTPK